MVDTQASTSEQFLSLLADFARATGLPGDADAQGVEFSVGEITVLVQPHPQRPEALIAEVEFVELEAAVSDRAEVFRLLHLINESARFEHDWLITLSPDERVLIFTTRMIAQTSAADLEGLLCEGIERAEALREILSVHSGDAGAVAGSAASGAMPLPDLNAIGGPGAGAIRG